MKSWTGLKYQGGKFVEVTETKREDRTDLDRALTRLVGAYLEERIIAQNNGQSSGREGQP